MIVHLLHAGRKVSQFADYSGSDSWGWVE